MNLNAAPLHGQQADFNTRALKAGGLISAFRQKVDDASKNTSEDNNTFGLSEAEKASIEADINAGKPITATPAYTKFLSALLPNGLKIQDKKTQLLKFSTDIPEYEIHNGSIGTNNAGANAIIAKGLSQLFGRTVRFPTALEVQEKIAEHKHFAGYRDAGYKSLDVGVVGYGWVAGDGDSNVASYAWRDRNGDYDSGMSDRRNGLSLFPYFG